MHTTNPTLHMYTIKLTLAMHTWRLHLSNINCTKQHSKLVQCTGKYTAQYTVEYTEQNNA